MPENLKDTGDVIHQLWPTWGNAEQRRQLQRVCGGWRNNELIPLAHQLADSGEVRFTTEVVRALRRAAVTKFGGKAAEQHGERTASQELCDMYREHWGRVNPEYRHKSDTEILLTLEQAECDAYRQRYGRVPSHVSRVTGRFEQSCTACDTGMMVYGAHDCDRHGTSGSDYMNQDRYWRCDRCGATERVTKPLTKPEPKPEGEPHATSCR